jgi:hypothetical protein
LADHAFTWAEALKDRLPSNRRVSKSLRIIFMGREVDLIVVGWMLG